jgi:hypothetical protein
MTQAIYKYGPIPFFNETYRKEKVVAIVEGNPVKAGLQNNKVFVWSIVAPDTDPEYRVTRNMVIYPTGMEFEGTYWFTVIDEDGFVWHVVEV